MLFQYASLFFLMRGLMCEATQGIKTALLKGESPPFTIIQAYKTCRDQIPAIKQQLMNLGLSASIGICDLILNSYPEIIPEEGAHLWAMQLDTTMNSLHQTIKTELDREFFYRVELKYVKYYNIRQFTDNQVEIVGGKFDMEEAGACLALGCSTACVFHLSRVIQAALNAIAKQYKFQYSPSWESILKRMRDERDARRKRANAKPSPPNASELRRDADYLADIEAKGHAIKDAWRNETIHCPAQRYSQDEAESIFRETQGFMAAIEKGLS